MKETENIKETETIKKRDALIEVISLLSMMDTIGGYILILLTIFVRYGIGSGYMPYLWIAVIVSTIGVCSLYYLNILERRNENERRVIARRYRASY